MNIVVLTAAASAAAALVAAGCWFLAGTKKVSPEEAVRRRNKFFEQNGRIAYAAWTLFDGSDMEFTLAEQSKWNRAGAIAAGVAAALQATSTLASIYP
jgi:hypothetical protein